jgi:hypothetical protein
VALAIIVALFLFRDQIRDLITPIRRARFPGGELEIDSKLDALQATTEKLESELEAVPLPAPPLRDTLTGEQAADPGEQISRPLRPHRVPP